MWEAETEKVVCYFCDEVIWSPDNIMRSQVVIGFSTCNICGRVVCNNCKLSEDCGINAFERICLVCAENAGSIIKRLQEIDIEKNQLLKKWKQQSANAGEGM